ncbi:MAG: crosslink repair DNA glycosylase YcaQ family protein [Chthoniobacteraceae bacterium]
MVGAITLSPIEARRFHRRAVGLDAPLKDVDDVLARHGFVQIDPINVCGRMHDLILRNRIAGYREDDLMRHLHGESGQRKASHERTAIEHHLPHSNNLAALPLAAWPYLLAAMRRRTQGEGSWSGKLEPRQEAMAREILVEMKTRGPLSSADFEKGETVDHGWGAGASLAKTTLHKLFFHGRVLIAQRKSQRRYYDLPERILPTAILKLPEPTPEERARWIALLKLRQARLTTLQKVELPLVADFVQPVAVVGCPPLFCLREDLPLLDQLPDPSPTPLLLAPLDPLIYHRKVTAQLWGFDYTWEVYTPPAKRQRGYYALPVLVGLEIVGHVDPKAERKQRKLVVINRSLRRGFAVAPAVKELARFLGLKAG